MNGFLVGVYVMNVVLFDGHRNSQYVEKGVCLVLRLTLIAQISCGVRGA